MNVITLRTAASALAASSYALVVLALLGGTATAQSPERFNATYGNWELRCEAAPAGDEGTEACEIIQAAQLQGQSQPLTRIAIGRPSNSQSMLMVVQVPIGIWIPDGIAIEMADSSFHPLPLKRCVPTACLADLEFSDDLKGLFEADPEGEGRLIFSSGPDQPSGVPVRHKGFSAAFSALSERLAAD